ncbi:MAG: hypothetical protein RLZ98_1111 [Pseudomonadota bacterium]
MATKREKPPRPTLPANLHTLFAAEFPHFSKAEMQRRRDALAAEMEKAGASHVLFAGGDRKGSAIQWLTEYPATNSHYLAFTPGKQDALSVNNPNNAPLARILAPALAVDWSPEGSLTLALAELKRRGADGKTVGVIGSYSHALHQKLVDAGIKPLDMNRSYTRLRLVKSNEELQWLQIGCSLTDLAVEALERETVPGLDEHDLADIIERAYVPWGGMTQIHYTGLTSMTDPACPVPWQIARNRKVAKGDVVFTEIAASFWGYPGQIQRTIAVQSEPTPLYRDLHAAADQTFNAIFEVLKPGVHVEKVLDVASCIDKAGFTICDDLVHGYCGGYLPPVLGTRERPSGPVPDFTFQENMTVVIQPSVMTHDGKAGVQTGELVLIAKDGARRMHQAPMGFRRTDA